jgi:hypothetical protein
VFSIRSGVRLFIFDVDVWFSFAVWCSDGTVAARIAVFHAPQLGIIATGA